jgi:hypothetical protein
MLVVNQGITNSDARLERGARADGFAEQREVHQRAAHRKSEEPVAVPAFDDNTSWTADDHALEAQRITFEDRQESEPAKYGHCSWIQRVAAQLLTGKPRSIDEAHPRTRPREHGGGDRASRTRANDKDVIHR